MPIVKLHPAAIQDLNSLIATHSLPVDVRDRLRRSLEPLGRFPEMGHALQGRWKDHRFLVGPWRWLVVVYHWSKEEDAVIVLSIEDARSGDAATAARA